MKIKINDEQELVDVCTEALHILSNLRKFTKLWEESYGVDLRRRKKYYEEKADELIERLQVPENRKQSQIKIEINGNNS